MASEEEAYYGSPAPATPASKAVKSGSTPGKAKARTKRLEEDLAAAREETQAIRKKLHNAIRKGKGIEQEKNALAGEVKRWRQEAESLKENMADASAGGAGAQEEEVDALKREVTSLEQKLEVERKVSEAGGKETAAKLEEKEEECRSLRKEMEHLQSAVRSAAERAANATVNETRASEERERELGQAKALQRRVAELEGLLEDAGESEQERQRMLTETLNLRNERDELETVKLRLEGDNAAKHEQLVRAEDELKSAQEDLVRATREAEEARAEGREAEREAERLAEDGRAQAEQAVKDAEERALEAERREEESSAAMQELTKTLQSLRADGEDRKKKFARLQQEYASKLEGARSEIERLELEAEGARRAAEEAEARAREAASGAAASAAAEEDGDGDGRGASQEELRSALLAATEPLSAKIDEYRGRLDEAEREAERQRQENRQLAASLARAEVTASSNLAAEEAAVGYKNDAEQTRQRELDLREELDAVIRDRDSLRRRNEELVAGDAAAGDQEVKLMREQLEEAQALRMREEDATRKCKQLQRENKDLRWQIAMTSSDDSIKIDVPKHLDPKRNLPQPKGPFAVLVKHRKHVAVCYLLFLHFLVYFALTHHSERSHHHQQGQLQHQ